MKLLCRACASKERGERQRATVRISAAQAPTAGDVEDLVVTTAVAKRLDKRAEAATAVPNELKIAKFANTAVLVAIVPLLFVVGNVATDRFDRGEWSGLQAWLLVLSGAIGLPAAVSALISTQIVAPLESQRREEIGRRTGALAAQRALEIEERERFYQSAEWLSLRREVIAKHGRVCAVCRIEIVADVDLSVDHIRPRSRYPALALSLENLQVLCRRCNSRKGAREI